MNNKARCYLSRNLVYLIPSAAPGAPQSLEVTGSTKDSVSIQWKAPADDGGSPVLGYFVERSLAASPRWIKITTTGQRQTIAL